MAVHLGIRKKSLALKMLHLLNYFFKKPGKVISEIILMKNINLFQTTAFYNARGPINK